MQRPRIACLVAAFRLMPSLPPRSETARLFTGQMMRILLPDVVSTQLLLHQFYEYDLTAYIVDALPRGSVFVDVGAHFGYHSLVATAILGSTGTIIAFEPSLTARRLLTANLSSQLNAIIEPCAVGSEQGVAILHDFDVRYSAFNTVMSHPRPIHQELADIPARSYKVPVVTLDDYFSRQAIVPDFVKIDAESSEMSVLVGMRQLLHDVGPTISIEVGDFGIPGAQPSRELIRFCCDLGYQPFEISDGRLIDHAVRAEYGYTNLILRKQSRMDA